MYKDDFRKLLSVMSDSDVAKWIIYNTSGERIVERRYPHGELSLLSAVIGFVRLKAPEEEQDFVMVRTILMCCPLSREFRKDPEFVTAADNLFSELYDEDIRVRDLYEDPKQLILYRYKKYKWYEPDVQNSIAVSCLDRIDQLTEKTMGDCCDLFAGAEEFRKNAGSFDFLSDSEYV